MNNSAGCSRSEQRTPQGPLLLYLASFERLLRTQGSAPPTIRHKVRLAGDFSVWLRKRGRGWRRYFRDRVVARTRVRRNHAGLPDHLTASLALKEKILAKTTPHAGRPGLLPSR